MGLGTLTLYGNTDVSARTGPERSGPYIVERWKYDTADATRAGTDLITCKSITKIVYVRGSNQDNFGGGDPFTIDNTVFPPTVLVGGVATNESGEVDIYGY